FFNEKCSQRQPPLKKKIKKDNSAYLILSSELSFFIILATIQLIIGVISDGFVNNLRSTSAKISTPVSVTRNVSLISITLWSRQMTGIICIIIFVSIIVRCLDIILIVS